MESGADLLRWCKANAGREVRPYAWMDAPNESGRAGEWGALRVGFGLMAVVDTLSV